MSVIDFPTSGLKQGMTSNGARKALMEIASHDTGPCSPDRWADWLLIELWLAGFKVVPTE